MLLLVLSFLFSHAFAIKAEKLLTDSYTSNLDMIGLQYKQIWLNSVSLSSQLLKDPHVQDYLYNRKDLEQTISEVKTVLEAVIERNTYFHSIYLYNAENGYLSTYAGYEGKTVSSDANLQDYLSSGSERTTSLDKRKTTFVLPEPDSEITKSEECNILSFVNLSDKTELKNALVVNISESAMRKLVSPKDKDGSQNFYLIDSDLFYLSNPKAEKYAESSINDPLFAEINQQKAFQGSLILKEKDGKKYLAIWKDLKEMRWRMVYMIPYQKVTESIQALQRNLIVFSVLFLFLFLLVLIYRSNRMEKRQILERKLMAFLKGEAKQKSLPFQPIQDVSLVVLRLGNKNEDLDYGDEQYIEARGCKWLYNYLWEPNQRDYLIHLEKSTYCFVTYQKPIELNAKIIDANALLIKKFGFDITSVMLTNQVTLDELPINLQKLRKKLKVLNLRMRGSMLLDCEMTQYEMIGNLPDTTLLKQALQNCDYPQYEKAYETILETLYLQDSYEHFKAMVFTMALLVQKYLSTQLDLLYFGGSVAWFNEVLACEEYSQLNELFLIVGRIVQDKTRFAPKDFQKETVKNIQGFINETLHDKNLTTAMVAEWFNLPVNYVRAQYKQHTGTTIYKTISSARLDTVIRLLEETELGLNTIRKKAGFVNFSYFYAYFKNEKGMSPQQYRSLYKKAKNQ